MKNIKLFIISLIFSIVSSKSDAQTNAMDFQGLDCNGNQVHLFSDLEAGKDSSSWVVDNNLPLFIPMDSGEVQVAYYGGFAMPTVVLLGGVNHEVLQNYYLGFDPSDTTAMKNSILNLLAGVKTLNYDNTTFEIFPNPSADFVKINFSLLENSNVKIELTDLNGHVLKVQNLQNQIKGKISHELNVSAIPNGTYFIKLTVNEDVLTEKIRVIHP
ncbi:MAG: T9SS type A sorting domain-containing protein [Flavobacteriia bacterium]|nr:T9SS type A sorting domain-containing protein [Flavobacteriia bacterium]